MHNEHDIAIRDERVEKCAKVSCMIGESVRNVRLSGASHSDQVGCYTSSFRGDVGNNVAPEV